MAERLSGWKRLRLGLKRLKLAYELRQLRRSGELKRILDASKYGYLRPGSFQGDDWFHVYPKGSKRQEDFVFSSLSENEVIGWILDRHRRGELH